MKKINHLAGSVGRLALLVLFVLAVTMLLSPQSAEASGPTLVVARGVQTGTVTFGSGAGDVGFNSGTSSYPASVTTLGTPVDSTKAFVHCTFSLSAVNIPSAIPTCELSNTQVTVTIAATSNIALPSFTRVRWYVVEFEGSVVVQRGTASFTSTQQEPGAALVSLGTAVDCAKSFVLTTARMTSTSATIDQRWTTTATLTGSGGSAPRTPCTSGTTSSLELFRNDTGTAVTVAWQVIQIEGVTVQRGTACISIGTPTCALAGSPSTGLTQGRSQGVNLGTAVTTGKSWVLTSRRGGTSVAGNDGLYTARVDFSCDGSTESGSCLRFDRGTVPTGQTNNTQVEFTYEVVSFDDTTASIGRVERKNAYVATLFTTGSSTTNITSNTNFSSNVVQARAVPFFSAMNDRVSGSSDLAAVNLTVKVNKSNLTFDRTSGGTRTETIGWQVVEFSGCDTDPTLCHVSVTAVSGTSSTTASTKVSWWPVYYDDSTGNACFTAGSSPSTCNVLVVRWLGTGALSSTWNGSAGPANGTQYTAGTLAGGGSCTATGSSAGTTTNPCIVARGTVTSGAVAASVTESNLANDGSTRYNYKVYVQTGAPTSPTYVTLGDSLSAVSVTPKLRSTSTGGQQWTYHASGGASLNSPFEDFGGLVYSTSSNHKVYALDSATGAEIDTVPVTIPGAPLGYLTWWPPPDGSGVLSQVVVGDQKGYVTALNGITGKRMWTRKIHTDPNDSTLGNLQAAPVVQAQRYANQAFKDKYNSAQYSNYTGDVVFVATRNTNDGSNQNRSNKVYALRATDGTSLWTFDPNNDTTNCSTTRSMDIVLATPGVDYNTNYLYVTTEDGPTAGQNSLWILNTLGPAASGAATDDCRGMLVSSSSTLLDIDTSLWMSYDLTTFYFQSANGLLRAYKTSDLTARIGGSTVITNIVAGSPGYLVKTSFWQDYDKYLQGQTRLYFVTQDGGVWCVDDLFNDFELCPEWTSNPAYQNVSASPSPTPFAAAMLMEPRIWVAGGDNTGSSHEGRGVLFQLSTADGSLEKTFTINGPCTGSGASADCGVVLGDISTGNAFDALYFGSDAGKLYRINLSGGYGTSLP